ncbi:MAG: microcin C ABC transporter permease YejB [Pseudomonadota bacterium]
MLAYLIRRLLLIIPTLFGIMVLNFVVIQFVPGGPIERIIAELQGLGGEATERFSGGGGETFEVADIAGDARGTDSVYRGSQGLSPEFLAELETLYGFDKPPLERFLLMIGNYLRFDFGTSYYRDVGVFELVLEKLPVSISLGLWSSLLIYAICIPLGIRKAITDGSKFDVYSSGVIGVGYAIPSFLFAIALIVLFAGGRYYQWFPLRGLTSSNFEELSNLAKIKDYFWHLTLPLAAIVINGFATLTMLTKNMFLEELHKPYVLTARAKGGSERRVFYGHIFRNAMLLIIAGLPSAFVSIFFTGSLLIEVIFSLDGLGLLAFEAIINRDYPVVLGTLYGFSLLGLIIVLISDFVYTLVDPRIDFEARTS